MTKFDPFAEFEKLLADFTNFQQISVIIAGDLFVNLAYVGFTQYAPIEHWGVEQLTQPA
ncbi:hypothetical protein [Armatimonas sp.]|uniref:hypothetical protein n=1 Tax=Armatimonas sp. TaxID=1872638 RepID=UPI00286CF7CA|nr:hypothetical protein [Armatimonas sp.]